jgi:multidrug efflux pump subunit AcrB
MKETKSNLIDWAMRYHVLPLTLASVLVILGVLGLFNMPRNEFPQFTIRQGVVAGYYPGASSAQVEEQLTKKVEEYLFSNNEVDKTKTYSYSKDGMMYIFLEVSEHVSDSDTKAFWNKIKNGVLTLQAQLPKEVKGIMVNSDFGNTSALLLAVESSTMPYKDLQKNVEEIEAELRHVKEVAKITHLGNLNEQISIYIDNNKLLQNGITSGSLLNVLQNEGAINGAGSEDGKVIDRPIHLTSFYKTEADLAEQVIRRDDHGNVTRLRDIATIKREYDEPDSYVTSNGTKSIIISLEMVGGKNIVQFGKALEERLEKVSANLPPNIKMVRLANQPEVVDESISHFMKEFGFALIGVVIVALILLPIRVAAVAAATIPITIAATLGIMYMLGIELNTVTLAALIVVLGIVVDDPIVVIDNHVEKIDHGMSVWDAAKSSAQELFPSVFTATLAISATFFPLMLFMTGTAKDFISVFPITISIALFLSLIISMLLVPYFNTLFIKKGLHDPNKQNDKKSMLDYLQAFFDKHIGNAIKYYKLTVVFGVLSVILGVVFMGMLPQQLFPTVDRNQFSIEVYLPSGYNLSQTDSVVKGMERILKKDERVENYTSFIGTSSPRFHTVYAPNLAAKNYAQILVNTISEDATKEVVAEYISKYKNVFPSAYVRMKQLNMAGVPAPIEIRISGDDIAKLKQVASRVTEIGKKHTQVIWVRSDYNEMQEGIKLNIKTQELARLGLTKQDISNTIAMHTDGINATRVWEGNYQIDVKVKASKASSKSISNLMDLNIPSQQTSGSVPLRQVADIQPDWHEGQLVRRNSIRTLTVRMDVAQKAVANDVLAALRPDIEALKLPNGVEIGYGGELEMQKENEGPMGTALLMSVILIFLILIWHFKKMKHALLSLTTMPLSLLGASFGLIVTGYPFGFTTFMGLLALCGIVVRNGIILIDYADELRAHEGKSVREAAVLSAERRMRPIFLTSCAAAVGVTPMIISGSPLWGPLGTVICFGLMISMLLTLFVLPTLYWLFFRKEDELTSEKQVEAVN